MAENAEPKILLTDAPDTADTAVIQEGLRAYNTSQAGYDDYRPLAVFVTDPESHRHFSPGFHSAPFQTRTVPSTALLASRVRPRGPEKTTSPVTNPRWPRRTASSMPVA